MNQAPLNKNREDKFILVLNLPEGIKEITDNVDRNNNRIHANSLEISIAGTVTPSISVPEQTVPYGSQSIKVSSHARPAYSSLNITFKIDTEYNNYWAIYKWLDVLNDVKRGTVNEDEIINAIDLVIEETNSKSIKDMGKIMSNLKEKYAGRCDFSIVSKLARERLI